MAKPTKKQVKKIEKQLAEGKIIAAEKPAKSVHVKGVSPSGLAVAKFLISELGTKDAKRIASGMVSAARTKSMKRDWPESKSARIRKRVSRRIRCVNLRFNRGRMPVRVRPIFCLRWHFYAGANPRRKS